MARMAEVERAVAQNQAKIAQLVSGGDYSLASEVTTELKDNLVKLTALSNALADLN